MQGAGRQDAAAAAGLPQQQDLRALLQQLPEHVQWQLQGMAPPDQVPALNQLRMQQMAALQSSLGGQGGLGQPSQLQQAMQAAAEVGRAASPGCCDTLWAALTHAMTGRRLFVPLLWRWDAGVCTGSIQCNMTAPCRTKPRRCSDKSWSCCSKPRCSGWALWGSSSSACCPQSSARPICWS